MAGGRKENFARGPYRTVQYSSTTSERVDPPTDPPPRSRVCYPRYDDRPGMHTGASRMHTGDHPYGNHLYATATCHRRRYEAGAAPTTTAYGGLREKVSS